MAVVSRGMQDSGDHHRLFTFQDLVNHAIRKSFGLTPAEVFDRMTPTVEQWIELQSIENLDDLFPEFPSQTGLLSIIPIGGLGDILRHLGPHQHTPIHQPERKRFFIFVSGTEESGFARCAANRDSTSA
jgi:hypothetical protein